ncbi:MAG: hypothetical protein CL570_04635 [Alphaproteobacteria bacterium]|nr:hypothetical protein [Alphaproteobacteria bacterium]
MNFNSCLKDKKIKGLNFSIDLSIREYWDLAEQIIDTNKFQRKKVSSSNKPYALLKKDLFEGCIMPPIILSTTDKFSSKYKDKISNALNSSNIQEHKQALQNLIEEAFKEKELIILDGLQRTYTISQCLKDSLGGTEEFQNHPIRAEVYVGLSKMGILYRMMTLNIGQTPMSFRHQVEALYHDYTDRNIQEYGIKLVTETDQSRINHIGDYKYHEAIDMFHAYTTGQPQSVDRKTVLDEMRKIEFLEHYKPEEDESEDLLSVLQSYNSLVQLIEDKSQQWQLTEEIKEQYDIERPFGDNIFKIFSKVQPMTGFGAECHRLLQQGKFTSLDTLSKELKKCDFKNDIDDGMSSIIIALEDIQKRATKIGDAQRRYFQMSFRHLLNKDSDAYLDLHSCWKAGKETYDSLFGI